MRTRGNKEPSYVSDKKNMREKIEKMAEKQENDGECWEKEYLRMWKDEGREGKGTKEGRKARE